MSVSEFPDRRPHPATEKAALIQEALATLQAAHVLDERDDLNPASWVAWYDATIPTVRDIKVLAGAMEIELLARRGEQILAEGEQRGRPAENATQRVAISKSATMQRSRARTVAKHRETVKKYVERRVAAQEVPTVRGALDSIYHLGPESAAPPA